jgi:eukaryotic-like serine/threonine-protein kinase
MTCLDDETVLGLVEGRLGDGVLATIDEHLDACASCRDVVTHVARTRTAIQPLERGFTLGRYVVGELVGAGAMGRVYSAWEPELDRRIAIKVLQDDAPGARERLVREAQAMARLDHPNVVGVHEVGTSEHGVYVAMELVDGETLRAWAAHAQPWRQVARVLAEVARGLAAVHAAGVLHRDVKPDNVIVGIDGRARLGDFGLARSGASNSTSSPVDVLAIGTPKTAAAGTPSYMAPQLLRGGAASEASDQYSFGVTAYEIIAGHRPFEGRSWKELVRATESGTIAKLPRLDAVIRKCLATDPAKRHASMGKVADLLEEAARARKPAIWIALGAAVVASGVTFAVTRHEAAGPTCEVGAITATWTAQARAALDAPSVAAVDRWVAAWQSSRREVCASNSPAPVIAARDRCLDRRRRELAALLARGKSERLVDALASLPPSECTTLAPGTADPLPLDPQQRAEVDAVTAALPDVRAAIALGDARPVQEALAKLVERARASNHAPTLAEVLLLQAEASRTLSNLPDATLFARDATAAAERGRDDLAAARAWIERTTIAGDRRELVAAEDLAALADAAIDRAGSPPHLVARLLRIRGLVAFNRGQTDEARRLLLDARARFVAVAGERSVEVSGVETSLGAVERVANNLDAAERHHRLAFDIDRELRGETHPDIARDLHNLAGIERLRGKLDAALALYQRALAIEDAARGKESVQSALTHNSIGLVLMARLDWVGARTEITLARDAFLKAGHGDLAFTEHNLGLIAAALKDPRTALAHFDIAARYYERTIGDDATAPIRLHLDRARARAALGEKRAARVDTAKARELAIRAKITWIVDDADALDAKTVLVAPPPPAPVPEPPGPEPKRDVGVYGSSQGW